MKTNIILNSEDRNLFGVTIRQETKTGFLNLSDLQEAYIYARVKNGWNDKRIDHIINYEDNKFRIYYILKEQDLIKVSIDTFINECENKGIIKYLKEIGVYKTTGARQNKTVFCNPYIWALIAMELNYIIYAKVIVWLTDKLIINRIEAGNFYKDLSRAVTKFDNVDYIKLAKSLNYKVFNRHETGIRNLASQEQLKKLYEIESKIAYAIDMDFINTFDDVIKYIEKFN